MNSVAAGTAHLSGANGRAVPINPQSTRPSVGHAKPVALQGQGGMFVLTSHLRRDKVYYRSNILSEA